MHFLHIFQGSVKSLQKQTPYFNMDSSQRHRSLWLHLCAGSVGSLVVRCIDTIWIPEGSLPFTSHYPYTVEFWVLGYPGNPELVYDGGGSCLTEPQNPGGHPCFLDQIWATCWLSMRGGPPQRIRRRTSAKPQSFQLPDNGDKRVRGSDSESLHCTIPSSYCKTTTLLFSLGASKETKPTTHFMRMHLNFYAWSLGHQCLKCLQPLLCVLHSVGKSSLCLPWEEKGGRRAPVRTLKEAIWKGFPLMPNI